MEPAMSTITLSAASFGSRTSHWNHFKLGLIEWRRRVRARNELMSLGLGGLRDIGLSRAAELEVSKPFWLA
jgi:uncharacterized protein YjiS (DUF1127 family)